MSDLVGQIQDILRGEISAGAEAIEGERNAAEQIATLVRTSAKEILCACADSCAKDTEIERLLALLREVDTVFQIYERETTGRLLNAMANIPIRVRAVLAHAHQQATSGSKDGHS